MSKILRIGTRDSQLAVWQATWVHNLLKEAGIASELIYLKSEGDLDTVTPLYALGVQGIFTKVLDAALLNNRIDLAVHSMKDVPTHMAQGIRQAAVLPRASSQDIFVYKDEDALQKIGYTHSNGWVRRPANVPGFTIATGSIRRTAQWLNRYPGHRIENVRGNVNTRLRKLQENDWNGAIFAAAGLERINLRPQQSVNLDWMLPAPAQGAILVACREEDGTAFTACSSFNDKDTALCTAVERDFLHALMGGCSTPISALARIDDGRVTLQGNILQPDGAFRVDVVKSAPVADAAALGKDAARAILLQGGDNIISSLRQKGPASHDEA
jgi:hydroxymethylbilane synthase